jgi:SPP1 gp7 family putative phage head morphogenesis protein
MTEELKDFGRFVKSRHKRGNWRAFDFTTFEAELADNLNEQAYFIVKGATPMPENIYEWASNIVNSEITDTPKGLVTKRKVSDLPNYHALTVLEEQHRKSIQIALAESITGAKAAVEQAVASAPPVGTHSSAIKMLVRQAIQHNVKVSTDESMKALTSLYQEAANHGSKNALSQVTMGKAGVTDGANMKDLLAKRGVTLNGINDTTISRISNTISIGIDNGSSASDIGVAVDSIINDVSRAAIIAVTESNRAYNAAAVDTYVSAGVEQFDWLAYDTACEECLALEEANPHEITDDVPPEHPSCRCTVAAVIGNSTNVPLSSEGDTAEEQTISEDPLYNSILDKFTQGAPMSIEDAASGANPNYTESKTARNVDYTKNCARVVQNYELRRRGFDVEANAYVNDMSQHVIKFVGKTWENPEKPGIDSYSLIQQGPKNAANAFKALDKLVSQSPESSRGFLWWEYKPGMGGGGHVINWEIKNGKAIFIDAQQNEIIDASHSFWKDGKNYQFIRVDNLKPTDSIAQYIKGA